MDNYIFISLKDVIPWIVYPRNKYLLNQCFPCTSKSIPQGELTNAILASSNIRVSYVFY
jgi:hypothetical protein